MKDVTQDIVYSVVGCMLGNQMTTVTGWQIEPIIYPTVSPNSRGLFRVHGTANLAGGIKDWSLVLKVLQAPNTNEMSEPTDSFYWKREALAYQSGLLARLPDCFSAPQCFGVMERPGNVIWLWLEEIQEMSGVVWHLARYLRAAYHLGYFNGTYAVPGVLPNDVWLSRGLIRAWVADSAYLVDCIQDTHIWNHPLLQHTRLPMFTPAILELWAQRERWFTTLEGLPQTLCHHDIWRKNLLTRSHPQHGDQTVAIDWEVVGKGAVGEDIGNLIGVSLLNFDIVAADMTAFAARMLDAYVQGLRDAGWQADRHVVCAVAQATAALRCGFSTAGWPAAIVRDSEKRDQYVRDTEQRWGRSIEDIFAQWAAVTSFLLAQIDEARMILLA